MTARHFKQSMLIAFALIAIRSMAADSTSPTVEANAPARSFIGHPSAGDPTDEGPPWSQEKLAEEVYKNIQIFRGLPSTGVMRGMSFFTRSLGVDCTHCHVANEFDKDDKPTKQTARKMYAMVQLSNKHLGITQVSCFMCHRGRPQPEPPPEAWKAEMEEIRKRGEQDARPAEQVYKNVQTLRGVTVGRWNLIMTMFTKALGVDCTHCHVPGAYDRDDKPAKVTARRMLSLTGAIAREIYKGPTSINCYTCHRGAVKPIAFPPAGAAPNSGPAPEMNAPELTSTAGLPSVDQVLDRYVVASGGAGAWESVTSSTTKGSMIAQGGLKAPFEVLTKRPDRMLMTMHVPGGSAMIGFNGTIAWEKNQSGVREMSGSEADFAKWQAISFAGPGLRRLYTRFEVKGKARLAGREVLVIDGTRPSGGIERLYFDSTSGLLARQDVTMDGPQGKTDVVLEFEDYREIDGVKLPFIRRVSRRGFTFIQTIEEIKHNVAVDDDAFEKPSK